MSRTFIATILIVLVVAVGAYFWISMEKEKAANQLQNQNGAVSTQPTSPEAYNNDYQIGMNSREVGDYVSAAQAFESAIVSATNEADTAEAYRRAGVANFLTNDTTKQIDGIRQLKSSIDTADRDTRKAVAIADLASLVCGSGCNQQIFEEVFSGEPYSQFYHPDDMSRSITDLYEWSISIAPVASALVRASTWYADQLLLNADNLSEAQRAEYISTLESHLTQAARESSALKPGERSQISFYFWSGYGYGALATVDRAKYAPLFETDYQRSIALGKFEPDGSNKNYAVLFAYYQYAALLEHLYGDARKSDIEANLQALITSVNGDPKPENNQFLLMAKNELSVPGLQHGFIGLSLTTLSQKYPYFKTFLESHNLPI